MRKKRTPEETQVAVERAEQLIAKGTPVAEALAREGVAGGSWAKYRTRKGKKKAAKKEKRPYNRKEVTVEEITHQFPTAGNKTVFIVTEDPAVIASLMEKLL